MGMTSWEEDALFEEWGWEKDMIKRRYVGPFGHAVTFDNVSDASQSGPEGEDELRKVVMEYGKK